MQTQIKYFIYRFLFLLGLSLSPISVRAQVSLPDDLRPEYVPASTIDGSAEDKITRLGGDFIITAMQIVGGIAIFFIILAGLRYVISIGEEDKVTKAKTALMWSIGGLILLLLSYAIVRFIVKIALVADEI